MSSYIPSTKAQQQEMLKIIGLNSLDDLYSMVPKDLILRDGPNIPSGKSELEVSRIMGRIAAKNKVFPTIFRGAGAYRHFIPTIVSSVVSKETFVTTYTPYQAEISQGVLQSIFEYQTMICQLTGLDASNASVYDGATAAAEAVAMCKGRHREKVVVSSSAPPDVIETIKSYSWASGAVVEIVPMVDCKTDLDALSAMMDDETACVYIHQPNYLGLLEDCTGAGEIAHGGGAKFIMGINPIAGAIIKSPGECGADIAVGEGQPLGMPLSFGGPYLGFMAATTAMTRSLPGRIVGETMDTDGNRAFVLTLQAREQHIRREKASSNLCTNQALCAMTVAVYLSAMGRQGLEDVAVQSMSKAHYLQEELDKLGFKLLHKGDFFNEFATSSPIDINLLMAELEGNDILGGLPIENGILWCATEMNTKAEIDTLARIIENLLSREGQSNEATI